MNNVELEEEASNDATTISELFNSGEAIQTSTESTTSVSIQKTPLAQKCDLQIISNSSDIPLTLSDATKQNLLVSLQQNHNVECADYFHSQHFSSVGNINKIHNRNVHIPYILNGELYQIQTQDGENVTVKCCHCPPDRVYRGSVRSTGNFHMHIKRRHPDLLEKLHNMKVNALLERRDRLMRNRKISNRNSRNRTNNSGTNLNDITQLNSEENLEHDSITSSKLDSVTETNLLHTHKLKIKTVFQRHQMQQRQAEEMRNWNNTEYVVMSMGKIPSDNEPDHPINFSLKPLDNSEIVDSLSSNSRESQQKQQLVENRSLQDIETQTQLESNAHLNNQIINNDRNGSTCESHSNLVTSSMSCQSAISSISSTDQHEVEASQLYNCYSFQHQNVPIIKPEQMILGTESEAIDLTMQADSGIYSSSEDNDFENNNNDSRISDEIAGAQKSSNAHITTASECMNNSENISNINTAKWHELLMQIENSLCDIRREMNVRNQIESNRMFLDIAKFKFLNPSFQFNW